jgi:hypothetical protein
MGILAFVLGRSGTGKSDSLRNFDPNEVEIINVQGKILPFKGAGKFNLINTDDADEIVDAIKDAAKKYKKIVVDDFQYVMANEFMRRSAEKGYDKFTEIGRHAWDIANVVRELPNDVIVYVMCHTDTDQEGFERLKTIGKLLDDKIVLEGMSTIVLNTSVSDGKYYFLTQNNGKDTTKSPAGMFPTYAIENDLKYVDDKIRNYYEIGDFKSDEEMAAADEEHKNEEISKEKRSRRAKKEASRSEDSESNDGSSPEEQPVKRSRREKKRAEDLEDLKKFNQAVASVADENGEADYVAAAEEFEKMDDDNDPDMNEEKPKRRTRKIRS